MYHKPQTVISPFGFIYIQRSAIGGAMNTEPVGVGETATGDKTGENGRRYGAQQHGERTISGDLFGYDMRNRYICRQNKYNYGIYQVDRTL